MNSSLVKRLALVAILCLGLAVMAGCGSSDDSSSSDAAADSTSEPGVDGDTITVGDLHSLSGTMAISEVAVRDSELMAIDEINERRCSRQADQGGPGRRRLRLADFR